MPHHPSASTQQTSHRQVMHRAAPSPILYACRLSDNALMCCGPLQHMLTGREEISADGLPLERPYLAAILSHSAQAQTTLIARVAPEQRLDDLDQITLRDDGREIAWEYDTALDEEGEAFGAFLDTLAYADIAKLYHLLLRFAFLQTDAIGNPVFIHLCKECLHRLEERASTLSYYTWLLPSLLYMEVHLPSHRFEKPRLVHVGKQGITTAKAEVFSVPYRPEGYDETLYSVLAFFPAELAETLPDGFLSLMVKDKLFPIRGIVGGRAPNPADMIAHLRQLPESHRLPLRDFINSKLVTRLSASAEQPAAARHLMRNLQLYLPPSHSGICEMDQPFGMNVELAIPIADEGVFLSGWIHNPLDLVDRITLISDAGFSMPLPDEMGYYRRPDVKELFDASGFPPATDRLGFVLYAEFPEELRERYRGWPETFSLRLAITLKGGLRYTIAPKCGMADPFLARRTLLGSINGRMDASSEGADVVAYAAQELQRACTEIVEIGKIHQFGTRPEDPRVSVVIPLYKIFTYLPAQIAHFAGDPFMRQTEVIYVLDSPEQEEELIARLRDLTKLYRFPVTLAVVTRNGGYATATNLGCSLAKAEHLLLMNSDILPTAYGWLETMLEAYESRVDIGLLAPKLLYEDGGLQHAGMYFAMNAAGEFYENLHYYKGYPATYGPANVSRDVPAVSGGCVLVGRALFEEIGGLSTEYIVGDFEDSDLCLQLAEASKKHHYCAEVALYHFERQSFGQASEGAEARYWLNASIHHEKWQETIKEVMTHYA